MRIELVLRGRALVARRLIGSIMIWIWFSYSSLCSWGGQQLHHNAAGSAAHSNNDSNYLTYSNYSAYSAYYDYFDDAHYSNFSDLSNYSYCKELKMLTSWPQVPSLVQFWTLQLELALRARGVSRLLQQYLPSAFCHLLAAVWVSPFQFRSICAS